MAHVSHHAASLVMKHAVCLHHIGCPDCIAGSTARTRSEQLPPQLPFTGQSHTASSGSSGTASSSQPATSHAGTGPATAGVSSSSTRLGTASEQAQLSGRSQAGRERRLAQAFSQSCMHTVLCLMSHHVTLRTACIQAG